MDKFILFNIFPQRTRFTSKQTIVCTIEIFCGKIKLGIFFFSFFKKKKLKNCQTSLFPFLLHFKVKIFEGQIKAAFVGPIAGGP
jgi:hypothetical protein